MIFQRALQFSLQNLYADDTSLTVSGCDLDILLTVINFHLPAVFDWLSCDELTLNVGKTKYILFISPGEKLTVICTYI